MQMKKKRKEKSIWETGKRNVLQVIFSRTMLFMILIVVQFAYIIARMYAWVEHIPLLLGGELLVVAVMMMIILNSKENPSVKLSWCFLVGVFPIFGSVVYLVIRYDLGYRVTQKRISYTETLSRDYLSEQEHTLTELKNEDMQTYHIAQYLYKTSGSMVSKNNNVEYFSVGEKMFERMIKQLESAKEYIFLEYFMISPGKMWNAILEVLVKKAREGVDVRVLYDGSCSVYLLPYKYPKQIEEMGIQCRMFSPPIPFLSTHYNNRDHRKIMVIDGNVAFTGGVNLCDEYININSPFGHWKDVGIMLKGDAVYDFTMMFLQMWTSTEKKKIEEIQFPDMHKYLAKTSYVMTNNVSKYVQKMSSNRKELNHEKNTSYNMGYVIPYADNPVARENTGKNVYIDILNQAKHYVYIMTPYLILDNEMLSAITFTAKRGIDVRIILPHIPDKKTAFVLAKSNYKVLLDAGVKVYEYTPGFVHAKIFVSDDERAIVGTINLDYRSLYWHYECAAYLYRVTAIKDIKKDFIETQELSEKVTPERIKKISFVSKMFAYILNIVAPLM